MSEFAIGFTVALLIAGWVGLLMYVDPWK